MPFKSVAPPLAPDITPHCPDCERGMQLSWIATGEENFRYTFECAACDIELEISDLFRDDPFLPVKSTH